MSSTASGPKKKKKSNKSQCPHVPSIGNISWKDIEGRSQSSACDYFGCRSYYDRPSWLCLHSGCFFSGCEGSGADRGYSSSSGKEDHSAMHAKNYRHPIAMNSNSRRIWCFVCETEVYSQNEPKYSIPEDLPNEGEVVVAKDSVKLYKVDDYLGDRAAESLGPVGLQNLGNTCYMNSALQALSSCVPLSMFMLKCPGFVTNRRSDGIVGPTFLQLTQQMWNAGAQREFITPSAMVDAIRGAKLILRIHQQQDSQEFLRCFMDGLHEDLKMAVSQKPPVESEEEEEGEEEQENRSHDLTDDEKESSSVKSANPCAAGDQLSRTKSLKKLQKTGKNKVREPVQYQSIVSDTFDGLINSSVQCHTCLRVSSTRETFQDLSLPIPSGDSLRELHSGGSGGTSMGGSPLTPPSSPGGAYSLSPKTPCDGQASWFLWESVYWIGRAVSRWFWGPTVSLSDCLSAFFSKDELKGDNMYSCEKCKKLRNGEKSVQVLRLPEVLCIHLKRFRHEFSFSSKIGTHVEFPLRGLDMSKYVHKDCMSSVMKYDLVAVICHHGSVGGGHYTALGRCGSDSWYQFDDSMVTPVSEDMATSSEAYVLFYQKANPASDQQLGIFSDLLTASTKAPSLLRFYISKKWLVRFETFAEPGPITNSDFMCDHEQPGIPPCNADIIGDLAAEIPQPAWEYLHKRYGGSPVVNRLTMCQVCQERARAVAEEVKQMKERQKVERLTFQEKNKDGAPVAISMSWFNQWQRFLNGDTPEIPPEIPSCNVSRHPSGYRANTHMSSSFRVSEAAWEYLIGVYGGGRPASRAESHKPSQSASPLLTENGQPSSSSSTYDPSSSSTSHDAASSNSSTMALSSTPSPTDSNSSTIETRMSAESSADSVSNQSVGADSGMSTQSSQSQVLMSGDDESLETDSLTSSQSAEQQHSQHGCATSEGQMFCSSDRAGAGHTSSEGVTSDFSQDGGTANGLSGSSPVSDDEKIAASKKKRKGRKSYS